MRRDIEKNRREVEKNWGERVRVERRKTGREGLREGEGRTCTESDKQGVIGGVWWRDLSVVICRLLHIEGERGW